MIDVTKKQAASVTDDSRRNPISRMLKHPKTDMGASAASNAAANKALERAPAPTKATTSDSTATVGATIKIKGDISGKEDIFVNGSIEGTVDLANNDATVENSGRVQGSIMAKQVRIKGEVIGDIEAREKITIYATGTVQGTIISPRVEVEDGAKFKGRIDMDIDAGKEDVAALKHPKN